MAKALVILQLLQHWAEENITILVRSLWFVTSPQDGCEQNVKIVFVYEIDKPLIDYLEHGKLLSELRHKIKIQLGASRFLYFKGTL